METTEKHWKNYTLNISIDQRTKNIWEAGKATKPEHYNNLTINYEREHTWFAKSSKVINRCTPEAIITRQQ